MFKAHHAVKHEKQLPVQAIALQGTHLGEEPLPEGQRDSLAHLTLVTHSAPSLH